DAQAEATAFDRTAMGFVAAIKAVEDPRQDSGGNAFAGITDGQHRLLWKPNETQFNTALGLVVFDGVVREIEQELAEPMSVADDGDGIAARHGDLDFGGEAKNFRIRDAV